MYQVKFYKGDYYHRQMQANEDKCAGYVEHHFNSSSTPSAGYSVVVVGSNASQTSKNWGGWYAQAIGREFDIEVGGNNGILVGGWNGRGDGNIKYTCMPAVLLEPLFASNPQHADYIKSESGQLRLAQVLSDSIKRFFPHGGTIGFSVGHKYKESRPNDRGAAVVGGGTEADYAEIVLDKARTLLEEIGEETTQRELLVMEDGKEVWKHPIDEDANLSWDPVRGVLKIRNSG
ncbi:MAG: N-acetylmuramoyl-L-alanine amidase [bacterium]|nr:N-acetylmuramoyl-L-alanine amidase [bacterium]